MKEVVVLEGARTAWAEYSGTPGFGQFKDISAVDLCSYTAKEAIKRSKINPQDINHVIIGNAMQTNADSVYGARHVGLKAGIPNTCPALTINRLCGSGIESVALATRLARLGEANVVLAGGMENLSQAPYVLRDMRGQPRIRFGAPITLEDFLFVGLKDGFCNLYMAQTAENLAKKYGISRQAQDEYALRSHKEGCRAVQSGLFKQEIIPIPLANGQVCELDDHIKPDTSLDKLGKLSASFGKEGTVTAGNASGIVDGAASVLVTTMDNASSKPIGKVIDYAVCGVEPEYMGIGPAPAIRDVLKKTSFKLDQIDLFEINEAFSAQYLAVEKELELDRSKVNVNGGSIAIGHPLGATGTRLILTLLYELQRRKKKLGIASACIGGGQGIALLVEAVF